MSASPGRTPRRPAPFLELGQEAVVVSPASGGAAGWTSAGRLDATGKLVPGAPGGRSSSASAVSSKINTSSLAVQSAASSLRTTANASASLSLAAIMFAVEIDHTSQY